MGSLVEGKNGKTMHQWQCGSRALDAALSSPGTAQPGRSGTGNRKSSVFAALTLLTAVCCAAQTPQVALSSQLTLSSASASPGGTVALNLSLASLGGATPSALEWTVNYPSSAVTAVSATIGPAGTAAGK